MAPLYKCIYALSIASEKRSAAEIRPCLRRFLVALDIGIAEFREFGSKEDGLASESNDRIFVSFIQTSRAVMKYYDAYLYRKMRLSIVKIAVLAVLDFSGGVMSPSEIAKTTCTERNNITTLVRRMSREGLVRTERNTNDNRSVNVVMTELGRELFTRARQVPREVRDHLMSSIAEDDLAMLEQPLETMRQKALKGIEQLTDRARYKPRSNRRPQSMHPVDAKT